MPETPAPPRALAPHADAPNLRLAETDADLLACRAVMLELRPHLADVDWVDRIRRQQAEGYRLLAGWQAGQVVAAAGYRILLNLAWGRFLYVDDLVTAVAWRSLGWGEALLDWLEAEARRQGCAQLHLDSGVQRFGAHRFYLRQRLDITSHHFARVLG